MTRKADIDVAVIGAGIWGLACAYACARRGLSVRVFEAKHIGAGASGGIVGAMAPHTPDPWNGKKAFQFQALDTAGAYWSEIAEVSGKNPGYARIGRLVPLPTNRALNLAKDRTDAARQNWGAAYDWSLIPDTPPTLNPNIAPFGWVHDTLSARIHPAQATQALAQACRAVGVDIVENAPVQRTDEGMATATAPIHATATIFAAGVGGFHLANLPTAGVKGQAAMLAADLGDLPQIYADGVYIVPHSNARVAVGSTSENTWTHDGTDDQLDTLLAKAAEILPTLANAPVLARWSGIRPRAPRRDPMLGPHPDMPKTYLALGAFKIGFGLAHAVGEALADCVENIRPEIPDSFTLEHHLK